MTCQSLLKIHKLATSLSLKYLYLSTCRTLCKCQAELSFKKIKLSFKKYYLLIAGQNHRPVSYSLCKVLGGLIEMQFVGN